MTAAGILEPPPNRNAGEWANDNRVLPPASPEPGPWRTDRVPFWWDIYAAFHSPKIEEVTVVCGAQMAKTESMFNIIGHRLDDGPYVPCLYIGPTEKAVKSISKDRIDKMFSSTSSLAQKLEGGQRNGVFEKFVGGVRLGFAWAGSATELASHPAGLVLLDEVDRMDGDVGGEGDPVSLARARAKNYSNRKIGTFSTPTVQGESAIWNLLDSAGAIFFYAWPCQHCKQDFVPCIELLRWPEGTNIEKRAASAVVVCPHCGGTHENKLKNTLNATGRYLKVRKLRDREQVAKNAVIMLDDYIVDDNNDVNARSCGFWISGICSPWASFFDIAVQLMRAYKSADPTKIQAIVNTYGGELFKVKGDAPAWEEVAANRRSYARSTIPSKDCQFLTMGADVQKNGIYYEVRAWGVEFENWLIEEDFIFGQTEYDNVWMQFDKVVGQQWGELPILRAFIDSGYKPGDAHKRPDHAVYTFCRRHPGVCFPTKGRDTMDKTLNTANIDYSMGGKTIKNGLTLYHVNTDYFKRWIHARIRWPEDATSGGWHLHNETTEDYCRQLVAEELIIKPSGQAVWLRKNKDNHYFDTCVLSTAAAFSLNVQALQPVKPEQQQRIEKAQRETRQQPAKHERRGLF